MEMQNISAKVLSFFVERFPDRQSILGVYAAVSLFIYSWMLLASFYRIPSWILFLTPSQIMSVLAYGFSESLVECILVLLVLLFLHYTLFLFFKNTDEFQARSIIVAFVLLASSMCRLLLFQEYSDTNEFTTGEFTWWAVTIVIGLPLAIFLPKIKKVQEAIRDIADRTTILVYLYTALSLISIVVVILRNIY